MKELFTLLILFQIKHFLCDYPLQTTYMLGKFKDKGWEIPLLAHSSVHGIFTCGIAYYFTGSVLLSFCLMMLDVLLHTFMDRIKASPRLLGKYKTADKKFWWSLGIDQMFHHLTHYVIIYFIIIGG